MVFEASTGVRVLFVYSIVYSPERRVTAAQFVSSAQLAHVGEVAGDGGGGGHGGAH